MILWGYPSADIIGNKKPEESLFPRPSDEIVFIEKYLGPIRYLIEYLINRIATVMTNEPVKIDIEDPHWELEKPPEKPVK